jgi:hypothetical protein
MGWSTWDYAKIVVPIVAGVVGTPAAGAAAAALMSGGEAKAKGGSWLDAAKAGAVSGGLSYAGGAALGGAASGAGGQAAGEAATKAAAPRMSQALGLEKALDTALAGKAGEQALTTGLAQGFGDAPLKEGINTALKSEMASHAAKRTGEAAAKARFLEHVQELGEPLMDAYGERQEKNKMMGEMSEAANAAFLRNNQDMYGGFGGGSAFEPWVPSYRR